MSEIRKTAIVVNNDAEKFAIDMSKRIDEYQSAGLQVSVQYRPVATRGMMAHSALILGRRIEV